ncbi:BLUF domain-containing protein [Neorhodopirellula lusitana]|uniref:BLUF domain-containing protein n=1 Tax=Neorhodopirellula lusitana TaxID=445327 RepID=UPI00384F289E
MFELVYCSAATRGMTALDLQNLLEVSRRNNALLDVTGILIYSERTREFIQLLEGEKDCVEQLLLTITADERHTSVDVMYRGGITDRSFKNWSMAFRQFEELDPELMEGYTTFNADSLSASLCGGRETRARTILSALSKEL